MPDDSKVPNVLKLTTRLADKLQQDRLSGRSSLSNALSSLGGALSDFASEVPAQEQADFAKGLNEVFGDLPSKLGAQSKLDEIITVGSVVVTYRPNLLNMRPEQRQKIRNAISAILTANPSADLEAIQDSIGITNVRIQRATPPPQDPGKYSDW